MLLFLGLSSMGMRLDLESCSINLGPNPMGMRLDLGRGSMHTGPPRLVGDLSYGWWVLFYPDNLSGLLPPCCLSVGSPGRRSASYNSLLMRLLLYPNSLYGLPPPCCLSVGSPGWRPTSHNSLLMRLLWEVGSSLLTRLLGEVGSSILTGLLWEVGRGLLMRLLWRPPIIPIKEFRQGNILSPRSHGWDRLLRSNRCRSYFRRS